MQKNILFMITLLLVLSACSSKNINGVKAKSNEIAISSKAPTDTNLDDEFDDEFESESKEIYDPLEGYNRWMTSVNDNFYIYVFDPVSRGYAVVIPKEARVGVSNAFHNLKFPIRFTNNLLQFKFDSSMKELGRFMINSTIGVLGLFDVAKTGGVNPQEEDFGQTLGYYGVGAGPHVVLPFFGPSNVRDAIGLSVDSAIAPTTNASLKYQIPNNTEKAFGLSAFYYLNRNSLHLGEYQNLKKDALDVYTFFRDSYEQKRANDIKK